jgi:Bax protein
MLLVSCDSVRRDAELDLIADIPKPDIEELPDFAGIPDVNEMKAEFFDYLEPIVYYHDQVIQAQRQILLSILDKNSNDHSLSEAELDFIEGLAEEYEVDLEEYSFEEALALLERRVDLIPEPLVMVQAAKESGWGRSRFAVEANNLFGQWCYSRGCGLVPEARAEGLRNEVKRFDSVEEAIASYMKNLNTHDSYLEFRLLRAELREEEKPLRGMDLADGLLFYSQRRQAYVDELKTMLRQYHEFQAAQLEYD